MAEVIPRARLRREIATAVEPLAFDPDAAVRIPEFGLLSHVDSGAVEVICEITWDGVTWRELGRDTFDANMRTRDGSPPRVRYDMVVWGEDDKPRTPLASRYRLVPTGNPTIEGVVTERRNPTASPVERHHSIALVQSTKKITTGSGTTLAYGSNTTANNLLCNTHSVYHGGSVTISTPTDSRSTSYAAIAAQQGVAGGGFIRSYYGVPGSSGANTVTFSADAGTDLTVVIAEFSGNATTTPLDNNSSGTGTSTSPSSGAQTPSENNCMIYGAAMHTGVDTTWAEGGSIVQENEGGSSNMPVAVQYIVQTTATSQAATWTLGASRTWYAHHGIFKAAAGAAAASLPPMNVPTRATRALLRR